MGLEWIEWTYANLLTGAHELIIHENAPVNTARNASQVFKDTILSEIDHQT